ncbi:hypothetical protein CHS0354_016777 [Potamilus streckersoni]|uniref:Fucosyltransferase n=1 Tax=Potamilus streckersoni TaxID=2493646 RepID=A0AAE0W5M6_9BIVA|nr:hypothetical protein CHS0354_016777 [Potamilus streckersoni]
MLTYKGKAFILIVFFFCTLLNLIIYNYMSRNIYVIYGRLNNPYIAAKRDLVNIKHSSVDNELTILKQRKYKLVDVPRLSTDKEEAYNASISKNTSNILKILWYNKPVWYGHNEEFCNKNMYRCFQSNCIVTYNRSLLKESDAILFAGNIASFPRNVPLTPSERNPNQVWIFFDVEPAFRYFNLNFKRKEWRSSFNWTMTYRLDSDIPHPYGVLLTNDNPPERDYRAIFRAKKKFAAWIVSHCNAVSKRDDFVRLLQIYVPVDIFGHCGTKKCPKKNCRENVGKEYKFYLSFENSLCKDYITEKFFEYLPLDMITVLRGHSNYNDLLPNDTYINTADFSTIQDLANFMKSLAEDEDEYILYLKSKDRYVSKSLSWSYCNALCDICYKLNNLDKYRMSYNDIVTWLESNTCVRASDIK